MSGKIKFYFGAKKENVGFTCGDMADTIEIEVNDIDSSVNSIVNSSQWVTVNSSESNIKIHINTKNVLWFESIPDKEEQ